MTIEDVTIPKKFIKVQADQPITAVQGDLWVDTDNNTLYQYTGSEWITVNQDLTNLYKQTAIMGIDVLKCLSHTSTSPSDYDTMYLDIFSDSSGYSDTVNTGSTDAVFDTNKYTNLSPAELPFHFKFNETSGTNALNSATSSNTSVNGGGSFTTGKINNGFSASGSGQVDLGFKLSQVSTTTASFGCWIKRIGAWGTNKSLMRNGSNSDSSTSGTVMLLQQSDGSIYYHIVGGSTHLGSTAVLTQDQWYWLYVELNGATSSIYLNNSLVNSSNKSSFNFSGNTKNFFLFGGDADDGQRYGSNVVLDDFRFYNKCLTSDERALVYNSGNGSETAVTNYGVASTKSIVTQTITLDSNITGYQLYTSHTGTVQFQLSFDNGSTWTSAKDLNTKYSNSTAGTSILLKINLNSGTTATAENYSLIVWY